MTERYTEWLQLLSARDWALTQFAGIALVVVVMWFGFDLYPASWRRWLRGAFLLCAAGGLLLALTLSLGGAQWNF
jgi:multisubunit Na+/H+ antiporter MnhB subunit